MYRLRPYISQKISAFWLSRVSTLAKTVKTSPVYLPWFQRSKNFAKLTKNLTKIMEFSTYVKNSSIFLTFLTFDFICWKLTVHFWHFGKIFSKFCKNGLKKGQKSQKLYQDFWHFNRRLGLSTFQLLSKMYRTIQALNFAKGSIILRNYTGLWKPYKFAWP